MIRKIRAQKKAKPLQLSLPDKCLNGLLLFSQLVNRVINLRNDDVAINSF